MEALFDGGWDSIVSKVDEENWDAFSESNEEVCKDMWNDVTALKEFKGVIAELEMLELWDDHEMYEEFRGRLGEENSELTSGHWVYEYKMDGVTEVQVSIQYPCYDRRWWIRTLLDDQDVEFHAFDPTPKLLGLCSLFNIDHENLKEEARKSPWVQESMRRQDIDFDVAWNAAYQAYREQEGVFLCDSTRPPSIPTEKLMAWIEKEKTTALDASIGRGDLAVVVSVGGDELTELANHLAQLEDMGEAEGRGFRVLKLAGKNIGKLEIYNTEECGVEGLVLENELLVPLQYGGYALSMARDVEGVSCDLELVRVREHCDVLEAKRHAKDMVDGMGEYAENRVKWSVGRFKNGFTSTQKNMFSKEEWRVMAMMGAHERELNDADFLPLPSKSAMDALLTKTELTTENFSALGKHTLATAALPLLNADGYQAVLEARGFDLNEKDEHGQRLGQRLLSSFREVRPKWFTREILTEKSRDTDAEVPFVLEMATWDGGVMSGDERLSWDDACVEKMVSLKIDFEKPEKIVIPFGSGDDTPTSTARLAQELSELNEKGFIASRTGPNIRVEAKLGKLLGLAEHPRVVQASLMKVLERDAVPETEKAERSRGRVL
jgi:hypothetical protein